MITHPEKVLFPPEEGNAGITKGELASYYEMIAAVMLPHIRARPVTMERYHRGIGAPGFFQKDVSKGFPDWLERVEVPKKSGTVHHPLVCDTRSSSSAIRSTSRRSSARPTATDASSWTPEGTGTARRSRRPTWRRADQGTAVVVHLSQLNLQPGTVSN